MIDLVEEDGSFHKLEKDFQGHNGFNQEELKLILNNLGYNTIKSHIFYSDIKAIGKEDIPYSLFIMYAKK